MDDFFLRVQEDYSRVVTTTKLPDGFEVRGFYKELWLSLCTLGNSSVCSVETEPHCLRDNLRMVFGADAV